MSIRAELAAAVRRINAAYYRCPEPRPEVIGQTWSRLETEIDAAVRSDDRDSRALRAIAAWEAHPPSVCGAGEEMSTRSVNAPIPRLALTVAEAAAACGVSDDYFSEHVGPELRWVRRGRKRLVVSTGSGAMARCQRERSSGRAAGCVNPLRQSVASSASLDWPTVRMVAAKTSGGAAYTALVAPA